MGTPRLTDIASSSRAVNETIGYDESYFYLSSNLFQIDLLKAKPIHRYSLAVHDADGNDVYQAVNSRLPDAEADNLMRQLFKHVLELDRAEGDKELVMDGCYEAFVYDNARTVYSVNRIDGVDFTLNKELVGEYLWEKLRVATDQIQFSMEFKATIRPEIITNDYIEFLRLLTWQSVFDRDSQFVVRNENYDHLSIAIDVPIYKNEAYKIGESLEVGQNDPRRGKIGFLKDIVQIEDRVFLRLTPKRSLFFPNSTLIVYLRKKLGLIDGEPLAPYIQTRQSREQLDIHLFGLKLRDPITLDIITVKEVSKKRAGKIKKINPENPKQSLIEFYHEERAFEGDPDLPCIISKDEIRPGNPYYLLESLEILNGQLCEKEDDTEAEKQIAQKFCLMSYNDVIKNLKSLAIIHDSLPYLQAFGIHIATTATIEKAKHLPPPQISYYDEIVQFNPNLAIPWKLQGNLELLERRSLNWSWVVVNFNNCIDNYNKWTDLVEHLKAFGRHLGLGKPAQKNLSLTGSIADTLSNLLYDQRNADVLILVAKPGDPEIRRLLKFYELERGNPVTIFLSSTDACANKFHPVMAKIIHKLNARLGRANFQLIPRPIIRPEFQSPGFNMIAQKAVPRQFIGIHWRQLDPFYAAGAVTYTTNDLCTIKGSYFIEALGISSSTRFDKALLDAVSDYTAINNRAPMQVVVFMQITRADDLTMSVQLLKDSIQGVVIRFKAEHRNEVTPKFIIVAMQSDAGDLLFHMSSHQNSSQNLDVGTCVDKTLVDSQSFLLVQSRPNHASAIVAPTRFTVYNDFPDELSISEAEYFTYYLCAMHPVECKMIYMPLPLRAAVDFTSRASSNLDVLKFLTRELDEEPSAKKPRLEQRMQDPFEDDLDENTRLDRLNTILNASGYYFCA